MRLHSQCIDTGARDHVGADGVPLMMVIVRDRPPHSDTAERSLEIAGTKPRRANSTFQAVTHVESGAELCGERRSRHRHMMLVRVASNVGAAVRRGKRPGFAVCGGRIEPTAPLAADAVARSHTSHLLPGEPIGQDIAAHRPPHPRIGRAARNGTLPWQ
jgi:hypothetical protein